MTLLFRFSALVILAMISAGSCRETDMKPDFDAALQSHFDAIANRDLEAFKAHMTKSNTLYTIVQNGHAFTTPKEIIAVHEQWFKDPNWIWKGEVVHKVVGDDMAMALVRYDYKPKPDDDGFSTWLIYVFQLQDGEWRIIHDQNTALDFKAFAQANGMEL